MYCIKCGAQNSDDANYCQKCGNILESEEITRVAGRREPLAVQLEETKIFSIRPTLMFVKLGYALAAIGALLLVAFFSVFLPGISRWIAVLLGLVLLLIPAYYHFRQKLSRYTLTDSKLEIDEGLLNRTTRNIPLRRITDVTVSSGIFHRMLGFGNLVIDNASEDGTKLVMRNINSPAKYSEAMLNQIRRLDG
ncbi:MAG: PH domain-containing protein [Pyrinomonadaceae bacterium]